MTIDKDQILVNQFIEALDKVSREMQPLDENDNIGYVLITKLKRVYEVYKDTVLSNNDFDYLIDYYSHLQTKDEENQVVKNPIPLFMQLSKHKKMIDTVKVQSDKKEDKEVKKYEYPIKIDNTSEWHYEGFILILRNNPKFSFAECKEVGFYYSTPAGLGHIIDEFRKAVDTKLQNDKEKDEDLFLVETFIEALSNINKKMETLKTDPNYRFVLEVKLGKLYEKAKDIFHFTSFDSFKTYYFMKFPDK